MSGNDDNRSEQRRRAVRTALVLAAVVAAVYLGFIARGVLNAG